MMGQATQRWSTQENLARFARGCRSFQGTECYMEEREELQGPLCNLTVVFKDNGDIVFQFFPKTRKWPREAGPGRALLSDLLEIYFGDLARFSASHVPELESWAVRAAGLTALPSYNREHHIDDFAAYVNLALSEL